jgi:hypothetical protein
MPEQEWIQLTFDGGLNTFERASLLEDNETPLLENWQWAQGGGLVPRPGWKAAGASPTGEPTSKRGRGLYTGWYQLGVRVFVASIYDNGSNYVTYRTNTVDPITFSSYTSIDTVAVSASYRELPMAYAVGNNVLLMSQPGFTSGQVRAYNGTSTSAVATNDIAGRCLIYHLNRFWTGGSVAQPTYLRFSEIGDHTNWNTSENFIPVSKDDGEPIEDIVVWDRGLIVGKKHSLWFVSGYSIDNFALQPITKNIGCAPGRSLIPTEDGVFIIAPDTNVYLYDGARLHKLTDRFSIPSVNTKYATGAYVGGTFYVKVADQAGYVYAWQDGRWRVENHDDAFNEPKELVAIDDVYLVCSSLNGTRLLSVRQETGAFGDSSYRDPDTDAGTTIGYYVETKQWWPKGPIGKSTLRSMYVKYHQWRAGTEKLYVDVYVDGVVVASQTKQMGGQAAAGTYAERVDFHAAEDATFSGKNIQLRFYSAVAIAGDPTYSIDDVWIQMLSDKGRR